MIPAHTDCLKPFPIGRRLVSPMTGQVIVKCKEGKARMQVLVGKSRIAKYNGDSPYTVAVSRTSPNLGFFMNFNNPIQALTVAEMIEKMEFVSEDALLRLGFVEDRREVLDRGSSTTN